MNFLLAHWHCILPILAIGVAIFLMRDRPKKGERKSEKQVGGLPYET